MDKFQPKLLHDSFSRLEDEARFAASREAVATSVVSWKFATGDMSIPEPFRKELYGDNAQWRKESAKPAKKDLRHGFDADYRLRVVETLDGEHICHLEYADSHCLRFGHSPPIPNQCVRRFEFDGQSQLVSQHILYAGHGCQHEYTWQNGVLLAVESIAWHQDCKRVARKWDEIELGTMTHIRQDYIYDDLGLFQIIDRYFNEDGTIDMATSGFVQYTRIPKGMTPSSLANEISEIIVRETPTLIRKAASKEASYYALLICYCAEDPVAGWPPFLLLANESVLLSKNDSRSPLKYIAWAPDELREMPENAEIQFCDAELRELCSLHSQIMLSRGPSSMKLALRQIVASLREVNWSGIVNTTVDFVIAAVDTPVR